MFETKQQLKSKKELLEKIEKLKEEYSEELHKEILKKAKTTKSGECIYNIAKYVPNAPIEFLAKRIQKPGDIYYEVRNIKWMLKFAIDFGHIDLEKLENNVCIYSYFYRENYEEGFGIIFNYEEYGNMVTELFKLEGVSREKIYEFLYEECQKDKNLNSVLIKIMNTGLLEPMQALDILSFTKTRDNVSSDTLAKSIYEFALNYADKLTISQNNDLIEKFIYSIRLKKKTIEKEEEAINLLIDFINNVNISPQQKYKLMCDPLNTGWRIK